MAGNADAKGFVERWRAILDAVPEGKTMSSRIPPSSGRTCS